MISLTQNKYKIVHRQHHKVALCCPKVTPGGVCLHKNPHNEQGIYKKDVKKSSHVTIHIGYFHLEKGEFQNKIH